MSCVVHTVVGPGGDGVHGQVELVLPTELEAGLAQRVVPLLTGTQYRQNDVIPVSDGTQARVRRGEVGVSSCLGAGVSLGEVGGVRGDAVGHESGLDVVTVGQAQVLLGRHVAQQG